MTARIPIPPFIGDTSLGQNKNIALKKYQAEFCLNEIAPQKHTVFNIDQSSLRPAMEKGAHWSIAWSDLMMTMFILFLSLFVYQAVHKDFLVSDEKEIVAGTTKEVLEVKEESRSAFPFMVIKPAAPYISSGTLRKLETEESELAPAQEITLQTIDLDATYSPVETEKTLAELAAEIPKIDIAQIKEQKPREDFNKIVSATPVESIIQPAPLSLGKNDDQSVNALFNESQVALDTFDLNEIAAIDLVPEKAVRIILTGDLLFATGAAALSEEAIYSLEKIAQIIAGTPYQVHIEGHTDDIPIVSGQYANNWELSFARANAVAVFLIEDMGMDPEQFVISGYASYRPVAPNTTADNRAANRRVEIVISQTPLNLEDTTLANSF